MQHKNRINVSDKINVFSYSIRKVATCHFHLIVELAVGIIPYIALVQISVNFLLTLKEPLTPCICFVGQLSRI